MLESADSDGTHTGRRPPGCERVRAPFQTVRPHAGSVRPVCVLGRAASARNRFTDESSRFDRAAFGRRRLVRRSVRRARLGAAPRVDRPPPARAGLLRALAEVEVRAADREQQLFDATHRDRLTALPNRLSFQGRSKPRSPTPRATRRASRCSASTSTASTPSTTRLDTASAISCCARSRRGCKRCCAAAT